MPKFLIKLKDQYCEWSTIVDAPVTYLMSRSEMEEYLLTEYGRSSEENNKKRLERCDEKGTSAMFEDVDSIIAHNRAGPKEGHLTKKEIIKQYQKPTQEA